MAGGARVRLTVPTANQINAEITALDQTLLKTYHDITEDSLYRADDVWSPITDGESEIESKYT